MYKIAIDGPAGAGKSTIAKYLAKKLNIEYIDTGAMYRAITLKAMRLGIDMEKNEEYGFLSETNLDFLNGKIFLDGEDVSEAIRSVDVTTNVSTPSKIGCVRSTLVDLQRKISESKSVIMDGRDIGTVVLPKADLKIYLDASVECRAKRRMLERAEKGLVISLEETKEEIIVRDIKDSTRVISPLKKADDAVLIDSSDMTVEEVVNKIINIMKERGLLSMSNVKFTEGLEVTGTIINVKKEAIYVDLGDDIRGAIFVNDIDGYVEGQKLIDKYNEGGQFTALVKQVAKDRKSDKPFIILSTKLYEAREKIPAFVELKEADEIIEAKVVDVNKGGADLEYNDFKVFLPIKNSSLSEDALRALKGETIKVVITSVYPDNLKVIASQVNAERKIKRLEKEAALASLANADVVTGTVEKVLEFGAIVNLGNVSGLLHQNELDHKRVKVADVVKVGDTVNVKVLEVKDGKISLSLKALKAHPWDVLKEQYHVGDVIEGVVEKVIPAGLIIKLTDEYNGLMPNVEYSWFVNKRVADNVKEGDTLTVKVVSIDDEKKRVSLSHRQTLENTWADIKLRRGETVSVTIVESLEKGAKVAYGNVEGFLPLSEVANGRRISKVEEAYEIGSVVEANVIECDPSRAKLVVSIRNLENAKERATFDNYKQKEADETPNTTIGDLLGSKFADLLKDKE